MESVKISIITVTYNCVNDIENTIKSVLSQDYPNLEYIVVDGASKDGTVDAIRKYNDHIQTFVSEPDKGLYDAMNKALSMATGSWCNFLNAGDAYIDSHTISSLFEGMSNSYGKKVLYGNTTYILRDGKTTDHHTSTYAQLKKTISRYQPYTHQAVFYNIENKSDCIYDLRYRVCADYDVACRYWNKYGASAYCYVPISVCCYKAYDGVSSNPQNARRAFKEKILIKWRNRMNPIELFKDIIRYVFHLV